MSVVHVNFARRTMNAGGLPTTAVRPAGSFLPLEASTPVVATPETASSSQSFQVASEVSIDDSMEDISETERVERFVSNSCGCA